MVRRKKPRIADSANASDDAFAARYPHIAAWVQDGWIELGRDELGYSFVRALDEGGMIWDGERQYATIDAALQALDAGIKRWIDATW
jgi:hypothetical protein